MVLFRVSSNGRRWFVQGKEPSVFKENAGFSIADFWNCVYAGVTGKGGACIEKC